MNMQPPSFSAKERRLLFTLAGIQFTHILDFMVMMPLGPLLTLQFGLSDLEFGYLVSAYTFSAAASSLLAASYVDRFERRRLMLILYAAFSVATAACAFAPGYGSLLAARIAAGFFGGVLTAMTNTMVGDAIAYSRRGEAMGIVMRAFAVSTVAGIPASLFLANAFGSWRAPFLVIAGLAALLWLIARHQLPRLDGHLGASQSASALGRIRTVLSDANHWRAFGFGMLIVLSSFPVIPYITIYTTSNLGLSMSQLPYLYLAGGIATYFTSRLFGRWADQYGKVRVYRIIAACSLVPLWLITHVTAAAFIPLLVISTLFFIFISGRLIPSSAIVASACDPASRGTYLTISGALQSLASGAAALIGGAIVARDGAGKLINYDWVGMLSITVGLAAIVLVGFVRVREDPRVS